MDAVFYAFVVFLFAAVILAIEGVYLWWMGTHGAAARRVARRLQLMSGSSGRSGERISILKQRPYSLNPALDRVLRRLPLTKRIDALPIVMQQSAQSTQAAAVTATGVLTAAVQETIVAGVADCLSADNLFVLRAMSTQGDTWLGLEPSNPDAVHAVVSCQATVSRAVLEPLVAPPALLYFTDTPAVPKVRDWLERVDRCGYWGLFRHPLAARWQDGRTVLIGDAAHPTLPFLAQGACMAIEDGWRLAHWLDRAPQAEALAAFEAERRPRVARIVDLASANARNYHLTGTRRRAAHAALRLGSTLSPGVIFDRFAWVYDYDPTAA